MPLSAEIIDYEFRSLSHEIDPRWLMGFAAAVGDARPEFIDTTLPTGLVAHPLFPIALEWPTYLLVVRELIGLGLSSEDAMLGTPLDHELTLYRTIRPGQTLTTAVAVRGVHPHALGSTVSMEWTTTRGGSALVARASARVLFPGSPLAGPAAGIDVRPDDATIDLRTRRPDRSGADDLVVRRGRRRLGVAAAHVFGECSNMWNPIHTDTAVADDAGRGGLTMPPVGLLAMTLSSVLQLVDGHPESVRRVRADFGSAVTLPAALTVETTSVPTLPSVGFAVTTDAGQVPIPAGIVVLEDGPIDPAASRPARETRPSGLRWQRAKSKF